MGNFPIPHRVKTWDISHMTETFRDRLKRAVPERGMKQVSLAAWCVSKNLILDRDNIGRYAREIISRIFKPNMADYRFGPDFWPGPKRKR
jgi:hypothetical protein